VLVALGAGLLAAWLGASAGAEGPLGPPSASISIESRSVAVGIGVSWGEGVLTLDGREHPFSVSGLSVADVGISKVSATGEVWGLSEAELANFDGNYYGVDVGVAVGGGSAGLAMRNQHGVYIKLRATQQGVKLSIASQGTTLKLK